MVSLGCIISVFLLCQGQDISSSTYQDPLIDIYASDFKFQSTFSIHVLESAQEPSLAECFPLTPRENGFVELIKQSDVYTAHPENAMLTILPVSPTAIFETKSKRSERLEDTCYLHLRKQTARLRYGPRWTPGSGGAFATVNGRTPLQWHDNSALHLSAFQDPSLHIDVGIFLSMGVITGDTSEYLMNSCVVDAVMVPMSQDAAASDGPEPANQWRKIPDDKRWATEYETRPFDYAVVSNGDYPEPSEGDQTSLNLVLELNNLDVEGNELLMQIPACNVSELTKQGRKGNHRCRVARNAIDSDLHLLLTTTKFIFFDHELPNGTVSVLASAIIYASAVPLVPTKSLDNILSRLPSRCEVRWDNILIAVEDPRTHNRINSGALKESLSNEGIRKAMVSLSEAYETVTSPQYPKSVLRRYMASCFGEYDLQYYFNTTKLELGPKDCWNGHDWNANRFSAPNIPQYVIPWAPLWKLE